MSGRGAVLLMRLFFFEVGGLRSEVRSLKQEVGTTPDGKKQRPGEVRKYTSSQATGNWQRVTVLHFN